MYLYPNPAGNEPIKVSIDVPDGQLATIFIYDLQGKLVMKSEGKVEYTMNPLEIDVTGFSAGLYIVKVETEGVLKTIRLVKL
ncbi:MAG: T9SS type A sorting domain-containing protein [Nostocaceae cyanobacterium CSU_2_110]|nr:T9SS type A sorting domain-containing protein [Nostocaceae cyanobacterium CSU_2_110]